MNAQKLNACVSATVVPLRSAPRPRPQRPARYVPFTAGQQAARLEFLAFQANAIRAEIQGSRAWAPAGCVDRLARIVGALETEAAMIEAGPELIDEFA